jgi:AraC-like DNA-binding protein
MNWISDIQRAIDFIEANLLESVSSDEVAAHIHTSSDYFGKLFLIVTGLTVSQYIRNRRLTLAAVELLNPKNKVIDVAAKYGYESPESFTKAFARFHKAVPSKIRAKPGALVYFRPLEIKITITGGFSMSNDLMSWATDENQRICIHNNSGEQGFYKVNPSIEEIEQALDETGKPHADASVPDYEFLIFDAKPSLQGDSMFMQTAFEDGKYAVEAAWFTKPNDNLTRRDHYHTEMSDIGEVKRILVAYTLGIAPDVTGWKDISVEFTAEEAAAGKA